MSRQDFILDHKIQDQKIGTATKDSPPLDYYCQIIQPQQQNLCDFVVNHMFFFEKFLNTFGFKKKEKMNLLAPGRKYSCPPDRLSAPAAPAPQIDPPR